MGTCQLGFMNAVAKNLKLVQDSGRHITKVAVDGSSRFTVSVLEKNGKLSRHVYEMSIPKGTGVFNPVK